MTQTSSQALLERLPTVRGGLTADASMASLTWFRVGGPADVLFRPADVEDLSAFLAACPLDIPITVVGVGSNLLVRDGGVRGVVIRLGATFGQVEILENNQLRAGAAALDMSVARRAAAAGIAGLEFYAGIPGSIGGALIMNGGAHGGETCDVLVSARAVRRSGEIVTLTNEDFSYSYRHSDVPADLIFVDGLFQGTAGERATIEAHMAEITQKREESQPIRTKTGGSTFKNPEGHKSWQLVDGAGCRGLVRGGAQVSEMHCNFLINTGAANAGDLEGLGEEVRTRVKETSGVSLEWEIKRIGELAHDD
ncbi:MAG: UDP-N-acetylmuramate dehydrogenase [Parvibaculaceae bacterium]|jgi:UDP-N-acetylmuramate dehydrogenase|tara:strand:- start:563 stop:1489 length:927 start_codon:yes stop_codon:yes gene_type:complete